MYFQLWYEFCLCGQQVDIASGKGDKYKYQKLKTKTFFAVLDVIFPGYKYHKLKTNTFVAVLDVIFLVITSQLVFNVYKYT